MDHRGRRVRQDSSSEEEQGAVGGGIRCDDRDLDEWYEAVLREDKEHESRRESGLGRGRLVEGDTVKGRTGRRNQRDGRGVAGAKDKSVWKVLVQGKDKEQPGWDVGEEKEMDVDEEIVIIDEPSGDEEIEGKDDGADVAGKDDERENASKGTEGTGEKKEKGTEGQTGTEITKGCSVALERLAVDVETSTDVDSGSGNKLVEKAKRKIDEIVDRVPLADGEKARKAAKKAKVYVERLGAEIGDREVRVGELVRELRDMKGKIKELKRKVRAQAKAVKESEEERQQKDQGGDDDCLEVGLEEEGLGEVEGD